MKKLSRLNLILDDDDNDDVNEEKSDSLDSVCTFCDNGGHLLCCDGVCKRSFHPSIEDGQESRCATLGLPQSEVETTKDYLCQNCKLKRHQCFACWRLESSDKEAEPQVFKCASETCGHFYHPKCVADIMFSNNKIEALECQRKIAEGQSFTCPVHKCSICGGRENKEDRDLQFAVCRRCPTTYHRKCLPRKIVFESTEEGSVQRAWDGLIPDRILIYCLKHDIDRELGTPSRNHIIFPHLKKKRLNVQRSKETVMVTNKHVFSVDAMRDRISIKPVKEAENLSRSEGRHLSLIPRKSALDEVYEFRKKIKRTADGTMEKKTAPDDENRRSVPVGSQSALCKKSISSHPQFDSRIAKKSENRKPDGLNTMEKKRSPNDSRIEKQSENRKPDGLNTMENKRSPEDRNKASVAAASQALCGKDVTRYPKTNGETVKLVDKVPLSCTSKDIIKKRSSDHASTGRNVDKSSAVGQVERPFEICCKLQSYVQNGDTIVDICCHDSGFSSLMKETLDASGKKCSFKKYHVGQSKDDINFSSKDWMKVDLDELPTGSQVIMHLSPHGEKSVLANKFIEKALAVKPKLVLLIAPPESERLDQKNPQYNLIWEEAGSLSRQRYLAPPRLYLWSRSDWTSKHKSIAKNQGHVSKDCKQSSKYGSQDTNMSNQPTVLENVEDSGKKNPPNTGPSSYARRKKAKRIRYREMHSKKKCEQSSKDESQHVNMKIPSFSILENVEEKDDTNPEEAKRENIGKRKTPDVDREDTMEAERSVKKHEPSDMGVSPPHPGENPETRAEIPSNQNSRLEAPPVVSGGLAANKIIEDTCADEFSNLSVRDAFEPGNHDQSAPSDDHILYDENGEVKSDARMYFALTPIQGGGSGGWISD